MTQDDVRFLLGFIISEVVLTSIKSVHPSHLHPPRLLSLVVRQEVPVLTPTNIKQRDGKRTCPEGGVSESPMSPRSQL